MEASEANKCPEGLYNRAEDEAPSLRRLCHDVEPSKSAPMPFGRTAMPFEVNRIAQPHADAHLEVVLYFINESAGANDNPAGA